MKATKPKEIFNLSHALPSYGENDVRLSFREAILTLDIYFDSKNQTQEVRQTVVFTQVCHYRVSSFPGASIGDIAYEDVSAALNGGLVEFQESEAAEKWRAHFSRAPRAVRHFLAVFTESNLMVEVFAADCQLAP